jgi:hypothetical protein
MSRRFAALRTGPTLARRLASIELGSLSDDDLLDFAHAEFRQLAQQQARVWAAFAEVARRTAVPFDGMGVVTPEQAADAATQELVAELRVSHPYAARELDHARRVEALPEVAAALRAGAIDRNRVLVLLDVCVGLSDAHRDAVLARVLPDADTVPPGKLRAQAQRVAIALDPQWAEKRYVEAIRHRRVVCVLGEDGAVTLAGHDLRVDEAKLAMAHVTALAAAAQRAGARASRDVLRAELFTGLLGTRFLGRTQLEIVAELVAQFPKPASEQPAAVEPVEPKATEPAAIEPDDAECEYEEFERLDLAELFDPPAEPLVDRAAPDRVVITPRARQDDPRRHIAREARRLAAERGRTRRSHRGGRGRRPAQAAGPIRGPAPGTGPPF